MQIRMSSKRSHKGKGSKAKSGKSRKSRESRKANTAPATRPLPTPEEAIGAVVEALAPELFATAPPAPEAPPSSPSGVHTILPRRGEEHRAHPRVAVAVAIGLETESHFFAGLSGDISEGGVFVQTYRDLPVGSDVNVLFDLPDGQLTAHGRVRWHRANSDSSPPGVGIAFEELDEGDRRVIQRFCESRAPLYYEVEHG